MRQLLAAPPVHPTPGWNALLTNGQHMAVSIALSAAFIVFISMLGFTVFKGKKIAGPYRNSYNAATLVLTIATLSHALLIYKFADSFNPLPGPGGMWGPTNSALFKLPFRYIDWAMTVPLLIIELIGASSLVGLRGYRLRTVGVISGFLMILAGWVGAQGVGNGYDLGARITWGLISSVFFVIVYGIVLYTVSRSFPELQPGTGRLFRIAAGVLLVTWFVYPILYGLGGLPATGNSVVGTQIAYSVADIFSKVGFTAFVLTVLLRRSKTYQESLPAKADGNQDPA